MSNLVINPYAFASPAAPGEDGGVGIAALSGALSTRTVGTWGYEFIPTVDGTINRLRRYTYGSSGGGAALDVVLYETATQAELARAAVIGVLDDWGETFLAAPVAVAAGTNYVVCVEATATNKGQCRDTNAAGIVFESVTYVTGRFLGGIGFPSSSVAGTVYGIADVGFAD